MNRIFHLAMAGAALASSPAIAATSTAVVTDSGKPLIFLHHKAGAYTPPLAHKAGIPAIYENFATLYPKGVYNASSGAALSGPNTLHGQIWLAAAFTPAASATVKEVDVAAGFISGTTNLVLVHIYADAAGVPGTELWSHRTMLPTFGDCCAIAVLNDHDKVKLTAGTQYWIGITTLPHATDTMAAWDLNVTDQVDAGIFAQNRGSGWQAGPALPVFAFGVYGQ